MTIISIITDINVKTVGDMGNISRSLPVFHLPNVTLSLETLSIIFPYALTLTIVGLMESLLTATILDDMTDTKSDKNKEVEGQGLSNIVSGFFGGMAGCALIGQSIINVKSGGRSRLSTLISGIFLLILIMFFGDIVKIIPMAALVGIMIMVSISTFEWDSIRDMKKMPLGCAAVMLTTMSVVIFTHNLAQGVIAGIVMSAIIFAWKITGIKAKEHVIEHDGTVCKIYKIYGQVFFASTTRFVDIFKYSEDPDEVIVDFKNAHIWDHSAVTGLSKVTQKYRQLGKQVSIIGLNSESSSIVSKVNDTIIEY